MGVKEPFPVLFFFFPLHVDPQLRHFPFINELFLFFFPHPSAIHRYANTAHLQVVCSNIHGTFGGLHQENIQY